MAELERNHAVTLGTGLATVLAPPTNWTAKAKVLLINVCNRGAAKAWFHLVLTKGGTDYKLVHQRDLEVGEVYPWTLPLTLESGDALKGQAQSTNSIDVVICGYEGVDT